MLGENEEIIESAHNDNDKGLVEQPNSGNDNQSGDHIEQVVQNIRTDQDHFGISRHVRLQDPTAADDGERIVIFNNSADVAVSALNIY